MTNRNLSFSFITLFILSFSNPVFANTPDSAYIFLGSGILVVLALAVYVVKQIIQSIRNDCDKRPVK
jgi:hypothetical protein